MPSFFERSLSDNLIGVVGPCSAGKTTLIAGLSKLGYTAQHIAQEHSYVPDMWQRLVNPKVLIYLDVSYTNSMKRRPLEMSETEFENQKGRLTHARQNADFYLQTDLLTPENVLESVVNFLKVIFSE